MIVVGRCVLCIVVGVFVGVVAVVGCGVRMEVFIVRPLSRREFRVVILVSSRAWMVAFSDVWMSSSSWVVYSQE